MEHSALSITLFTLIVSTIELVVCLVCAVLLWRKRCEVQDNSRLMLALGAAHCVLTSLGKFFLLFTSPTQNLYHEVLSPASTRLGLLSTLLLLGYGISVVKPEWFKSWRGVLAFFSPGLLMLAVFLCIPSYCPLYSFEDICRNITEADVLFRVLQYPLIILYSLIMLFGLVNIRKTGADSLWVRLVLLDY